MADLAASRPTDVTSDRTGLLPRAGDMLTQFRAVSEQPAFRRALPTIVAVIVTLIGMVAYFLMQQPSRTTLYASLPETEKSRVLDALKNAGVDVVLDPTTGDVMVPASDYHSSRIMLAAQGLPTVVPTGYENLDSIQMGSSRSVESMRLKQAQELELARSVAEIEHVLSARVHLALPEREVFIRRNPSPQPLYLYSWPKAAFWAAHKLTIIHLVSSSVPKLAKEDVSVIDHNGSLLSNPTTPNGRINDAEFEHRVRMEETYRNRIISLLTPIVGPGNINAQVESGY